MTELVQQVNAGVQGRSKHRWFVMVLIFLVYVVATADRSSVGFAMPFIRKEFGLTNTEAGAIMSMFFFGYAISQIPSGFFMSRFGVRKVFATAFTVLSASVLSIAFSPAIAFIKYARGVVGLFQAPVANGLMTTVNNWFPPREKGTATGLFMSSSKMGPLLVPFVCAAIIQMWGWREIFMFFAAPWLVMLVLWFIFVKNSPAESKYCNQEEVEYIADRSVDQKTAQQKKVYDLTWLDKIIRAQPFELITTKARVFRSWAVIGDALAFFFVMAMVSVIMNWLPTYLTSVKKLNLATMALAAAAPFAGTVIGNIAGGWFSDKFLDGRRKPMMMVTTIGAAVMMYSLTYASSEPVILTVHLFVVGFVLALGYANFVAYPAALTSKEVFPVATALMNTGGQFGAASAPLIVGFLLDHYNWDTVFMALALGSVLALLFVISIPEARNKPV